MKDIGENWMLVLGLFICVGGCATCNHSNNLKSIEKHKVHHEMYNECTYEAESDTISLEKD